MTPLEVLVTALDKTLTGWEPDDAASRFAESLRRNIADMAPGVPPQPEPTPALQETQAIWNAWEALKDLDPAAQDRAMTWLRDRLAAARKPEPSPWYSDDPPF